MFCDCTDLEIRGFRCSPERMDVCIPEHLGPGILTSIQAELLPMCVLPQVSQWQTFCKFKMHLSTSIVPALQLLIKYLTLHFS